MTLAGGRELIEKFFSLLPGNEQQMI